MTSSPSDQAVPASPNEDAQLAAVVSRHVVLDETRAVVGFRFTVRGQRSDLPLTTDQITTAIDDFAETYPLAHLTDGRDAYVPVTPEHLQGVWPLPEPASAVSLVISSADAADASVRAAAGERRDLGWRIAVEMASPDADLGFEHDEIDAVLIRADDLPQVSARLLAQLHDAGVLIIADGVYTDDLAAECLVTGATLVAGPLSPGQRPDFSKIKFSPSQLTTLSLMALLAADEVNLKAVANEIRLDPSLSLRVLRLANSSATGLRNPVDSIQQAVVLLGPKPLTALAAATLVGAHETARDGLWTILARATTCQNLSRSAAGYTVGLISGTATLLGIGPEQLTSHVGVSEVIRDAVIEFRGPEGKALAAVLAHEQDDREAIAATGHSMTNVAHYYLGAVMNSLGSLNSLLEV